MVISGTHLEECQVVLDFMASSHPNYDELVQECTVEHRLATNDELFSAVLTDVEEFDLSTGEALDYNNQCENTAKWFISHI
jgi:hypothetical protein